MMAIDISEIVGPNADAGHAAIKAARQGDKSKIAARLRDPDVTLLLAERNWLAAELMGEHNNPAHRKENSLDKKSADAFRAWANYFACRRKIKVKYPDGKIENLAKKDAAKELKISLKTLQTHMSFFYEKDSNGKHKIDTNGRPKVMSRFIPSIWGAEVALMTDEEYAAHQEEIK